MTGSQNAVFTGAAPDDPEFEHPPGAGLARILVGAVAAEDWQAGDIDNWRDSGWEFRCRRDSADVDVILAATLESQEWYLQITPHYAPGIIGRLRGKVASAGVGNVFAVAEVAHRALESRGHSGFRWRWNGYPHERQSTPEPTTWSEAS